MRRTLCIACAMLLLAALPSPARKWRTLEGCTLIPDESNDGDSFHVKYRRHRYIFRLYFADAPETDRLVPERVTEQAAYWDIDEDKVLRLGKEAAAFTRKFLQGEFTVYTKLSDARGRRDKPRYYAIVQADQKDLAEALVENGLARIYGEDIDLPDGTSSTTIWWRLKTAERNAKKFRLGGWAPSDSPTRAEEPAPPQPTVTADMPERDLTLSRTIAVYSLKEPFAQVGMLQKGAPVRLLGLESPSMARIRFAGPDGKVFEAQCRRVDLGL
jgi:endonuclease YncB( thermonuclease family)